MNKQDQIDQSVLQQYQLVRKVGEGAYGLVWKAKCKKSNRVVALKKIFDAFQHSTDAQRTFRQISVLKQLEHPHIIPLYNIHDASNNRDIYLTFQYMESDLYHLIYEGKLEQIHIKYILYQILKALHYLHSASIIHRDLKPSNILINNDCFVRVCDFGLVRLMGQDTTQDIMTQGVATRWYRAPEVLLGSHQYDQKADIWSLGCIGLEMLLKNPLFPGKCTTNQLQRILQFTGKPSRAQISSLKAELASVMISELVNTIPVKSKKKQIFSSVEDKKLVDFLQKLLEFSPEKRLTAKEALQHPYFEDFFISDDLKIKKQKIRLLASENEKLQTEQYIRLIKEKFVKAQGSPCRKKNRESPKCFSDLKKPRTNSTNSKQKNIKPNSKQKQACTLFQDLCKQKASSIPKRESLTKYSARKKIPNKENLNENTIKKQSEILRSPLNRFVDKNQNSSFNGLRKVSKIMK